MVLRLSSRANNLTIFLGMVGACIIIFLLAVLYEGLKVFREYLLKKALVTGSKYQEVTIGANGQSVVPDAQVKSR